MVWTSASFGYYLIGPQLKYIKGDFYLNNITSAITEIIANGVSGVIFQLLGINKTLLISYTVALAGMVSLLAANTSNQALLSLFILGSKCGVCLLFNLAFVANTHLFPIELVATSYSVCNLFARGSSFLAPQVAEAKPAEIAKWVFIVLMTASLVVTSIIREPKKGKKGDSVHD